MTDPKMPDPIRVGPLSLTIDPNQAFKRPLEAILEACGYIPIWIFDSPDDPFLTTLNREYAFAGGWQSFEGPALDSRSRWIYPGDPPLDPLIRIEREGETLLQFQYGLVALTTNGITSFARLD